MNPGAWVKGGGAGGGGGSGSGSGGKGKQGAGGKNGGDGANGDGRGAGSCGPGSGGGCGNPSHGNKGTHAGDPVDPVTGRVYTLPEVDLPLVGPLPFRLERAYSSFATDRDVGLGFGWSHSLAWSIELRRRTMRIQTPFSGEMVCALPDVGETITVGGLGRLRRSAALVELVDEQQHLIHRFEPQPGKPAQLRLVAVHDRSGNCITLHEDEAGRLVTITDSAGRRATVRRSSRGHIEGYELIMPAGRRVCHRRLVIDDRGDLVATVDALGRRMSYAYDDEHRLLRQQLPSGLTVHFVYDLAGRCVQSWTDHGDVDDPALDDDVPAVLADRATPARGMLHVRLEYGQDFTNVHDSRMTRRVDHGASGTVDMVVGAGVESLRYDEHGRVISYLDPNQQATSYQRDAAGRVVGVRDPLGGALSLSYDERGDLVESVDALGRVLRYAYDGTGNLRETADAIGILLQTTHDARGQRVVAEMPNGAVTRFEYDAMGNVTALTEPNGKTRHFEVDDLGRVTAFTDEEGHRTVYDYDAMNGLRAITHPNGAVDSFELDVDGRLCSYTAPDGGVWRLHWGGYHCVHTLEKPTGETLRFFYDREAQLTRVINERGETHRIGRDVAGRIVAEEHFDGRRYRYSLDPAGRLVKVVNGAEETTELEHDAAGRLVRRAHDDLEETFEVDACGRLVRSSNGQVVCEWLHDARGNIVREQQIFEGRAVVVDHTYNAANQRIATRTNLGYAVDLELDLMGRATRVNLDGQSTIERVYDGLGREVMRVLPRGGHIVSRYDGISRLVERRISRGQTQPEREAPAWVGALPRGTTFAESFARAATGDVVEHATSDGVHDRFAYDLAGRVAERVTKSGAREAYAYAGAGATLETQGPPRAYGHGGALLSRGTVTYEYDGEGRRRRKLEAEGATTEYHYDPKGMLAAVVMPDGTRIDNVYDTQGRRILKRVIEPGGARRDTRFAWADDVLLQEETWLTTPGTEPVILSARWYVTDAGGSVLAHRRRTFTSGEVRDGDWVHYALGASDLPELLVSGEGALVARFRASVWGALTVEKGATEDTPWRFRGQYFDEETGLCQNGFRFYDPQVGLFISTDPTGIQGALASYEYADSRPHRTVDPDGLAGFMGSTIQGSAGTGTGKSGASGTAGLHDVVKQALPPTVNGTNPSSGPAQPGECAEPKALSNYIKEWEKTNGPLDPNDKPRVKECLDSISSVKANERKSGDARSPCPNCSQMFANLQAKYGSPKASVIQPGGTTPGSGIPAPTNFEPPQAGYQGPSHASYPVP
jgi:RHS repeat-associated protein